MDAAQSALRVEKDAAGTQGTRDFLHIAGPVLIGEHAGIC